MIPKYRLLKEIPLHKAGTEFERSGNSYYPLPRNSYTWEAAQLASIHMNIVEKNPDWFVEVTEETVLTVWVEGKQYVELAALQKARKEAFDAARKLQWGGTVSGYMGEGLTFKTFADYYNSLLR